MKLITIVIMIIAILIALIILLLLSLNYFVFKLFRKRANPDTRFKFLSLKDYPNLKMKEISLTNVYHAKLHGALFNYLNKDYHGVIIFYHGLFSGYINYLNVINYLAKAGFIVIAFDNYGSYTSEGKSLKGLPTIDKDNRLIINFIKNNPNLNKYPLFTLGHSWGGHAALTSLIHDDLAIKKAVALSPYNSNVDVTYSTSNKIRIFAPFIYLLNLIKFGHEATYSVTSALKYTTAKVLIYCGEKDEIVKPKYSYEKYLKTVNDNHLDQVTIKYKENRQHFIYLSKRSEEYFTKEIAFPRTAPIYFDHLDYSLVNELDEKVMEEIVNFFLTN